MAHDQQLRWDPRDSQAPVASHPSDAAPAQATMHEAILPLGPFAPSGQARTFDVFSLLVLLAAGVLAGQAISAFAGWALRIASDEPGAVELLPMAPSSAAAFLALALAMGCLALFEKSVIGRRIAAVAVALLLLLAGAGIVTLTAGTLAVGLDRWVLDALGAGAEVVGARGRMPVAAALAFSLTIPPVAIVLVGQRRKAVVYAGQTSALLVSVIGLLFMLGYAYGRPGAYGHEAFSMALSSAVSFTVAGIGLIALLLRSPVLTHLAEAQWLRQASAAKSEFLSRMSHELRTPLNAILGFGQLLELQVERADDRENARQIVKAGRHLLGLIDEVLDLAKIESGRLPLSLEPVSVHDVMLEALDLVRHAAAERSVTVTITEPRAVDVYARADRQRLKQVLLNLLSNGIKFNMEGGSVKLSWTRTHDLVRISVEDTAGGIPQALLPRLFAPFERLGAGARGIEGTGLGLTLSRDLVMAMGGKLDLETSPGAGSTFAVELPAAAPVPGARVAGPAAPAPRPRATAAHHILYIEDNLSNLQLVERILALRPSIEVVGAMQGRIGLDLVKEVRPSLILLDVHLPDMDAMEVLLRLRHNGSESQVPVVIVSADATERQKARMLAAGAQGYLVKPIVVEEFLELIDSLLGAGVER